MPAPNAPRLAVLETISDPGKAGRANEDRLGFNDCAAFVVDGATGLGDRQFMHGFGSDAAWIAEFATTRLLAQLTAESDPAALVRSVCAEAREAFFAVAGEQPRYAWPLSALALVHATKEGLAFHGLGDSCLYLLEEGAEEAEFLIALPGTYEREQQSARRHIERMGGLGQAGSAVGDPETLRQLREGRARQNTPEGTVWSLGLVPEAADHIVKLPLPLKGPATALVCTDGLADLVALYKAYDGASLIRAAAQHGLPSLVAELRRLEREVDPNGLTFPRYKQSDDTSAILLRLEP